jgi:hypothetical protein
MKRILQVKTDAQRFLDARYQATVDASLTANHRKSREIDMINAKLRFGVALLAGMGMLSACGGAPPPMRTTTTEQTTTTTPRPVVSTTTTTTEHTRQP